MARQTSKGTCSFCKKTFAKGSMTRHLQACPELAWASLQPAGKQKKKPAKFFHLVVEGRDAPGYWLHLEVPASDTLGELDFFLRGLWLECCGHLSAFTIDGTQYTVSPSPVSFPGLPEELSMDVPLGKLLEPGIVFQYEYDFGTTTALKLKVIAERDGGERDEVLRLLARNEPPEIPCDVCGTRPAAEICGECRYDEGGWLCTSCAKKHECGDEVMLPVVNSPRVGECGYTGEA